METFKGLNSFHVYKMLCSCWYVCHSCKYRSEENFEFENVDIKMLFRFECIEIGEEKFTFTNCSNYEIVKVACIWIFLRFSNARIWKASKILKYLNLKFDVYKMLCSCWYVCHNCKYRWEGNFEFENVDIQMFFRFECIEISKEKFTVTNCSNFEIVEGARIRFFFTGFQMPGSERHRKF